MKRIADYQKDFSQLIPVFVEPEDGRYFAKIFRDEVVKRLKHNNNVNDNSQRWERVLTTYLDNDDALNVRFVEDLQQRASVLPDDTFIYYSDGLQFYTDYKCLMQINYTRNHFVSIVESGKPSEVKTIYGYGSHYFLDRIKGAKIEYVSDLPLWCEIIHERNMCNDAYFVGAKMLKDREALKCGFAIDETVSSGVGLYLFRFLPRYGRTFIRRCRNRLFGRQW